MHLEEAPVRPRKVLVILQPILESILDLGEHLFLIEVGRVRTRLKLRLRLISQRERHKKLSPYLTAGNLANARVAVSLARIAIAKVSPSLGCGEVVIANSSPPSTVSLGEIAIANPSPPKTPWRDPLPSPSQLAIPIFDLHIDNPH
jgi:hypothetical protein